MTTDSICRIVHLGPKSDRRLPIALTGLVAVLAAFGAWKLASMYERAVRQITPESSAHRSFDVSPTGGAIVFSGKGKGERDLYLLDLSSETVRRITDTPAYEIDPVFTPDGTALIYAAAAAPLIDLPAHLYRRRLADGTTEQLTDQPTWDQLPRISDDGKRIAFTRMKTVFHFQWGLAGPNWSDAHLEVLDLTSNRLRSLDTSYWPFLDCEWLGQNIAYIRHRIDRSGSFADLMFADSQGKRAPQRYEVKGYPSGVANLAPDDMIYFEIGGLHQLTLVDSSPRCVSKEGYDLFAGQARIGRPRYSSKRQTLFFVTPAGASNYGELWSWDLSRKITRRVADGSLFDDPLNWKPAADDDFWAGS